MDGIFTDIKVEQDKIVLTLSDDTVVNIPFAAAFKLSIETDDVVYEKRGEVIEVPYQVSGKTSGTVVDVMGYDPNYFDVEVTAEKILITPLTSQSAAVMSVIADSKVGLVSIVKLCVNYECAYTVDPAPVYTAGTGTLFTAKARLNRSMPFGTYTFRWSNFGAAPRVRHWFCFGDGVEMKADIRPG